MGKSLIRLFVKLHLSSNPYVIVTPYTLTLICAPTKGIWVTLPVSVPRTSASGVGPTQLAVFHDFCFSC